MPSKTNRKAHILNGICAGEGEGLGILTGPGELTERYKINLYDKAIPIIDEKVIIKDRKDNA